MVIAAPLLIPFATLVGIPIAGLGVIEIGKKVQDFVDNNPDATMEILTMLVPGSQGLSTLFKKKAKPIEEEIEISVEEKDPRDLTKKEKAEIMKETAKSSSNKSRDMKKAFEDVIKPGKEEDEFLEGEERYDGGLEEVGKAKGYDYKKFFKADGGRVGYQTGGITVGGSTSLASLQRQGYRPQATTQDYTNALRKVSAGTTYQQQAQAKDYARNEAANELRAARRGGDVALDNFLNSAGPGASMYRSIFTDSRPGRNRQGAFTSTYEMKKDQLLDLLMNRKLQPTEYSQPKIDQRRQNEFADYMNNLISSTYGKEDDYKAEAMTLNMPTSAYFDYLTTSDPKDVMTSYDTLSRDPNFDPKTYVATDYSNPETPRPPSPYETYFQRELQRQTSAGLPEAQRIQQGQVLGLPSVLSGPPQSGSMQNPGYMKYEDSLAQNRALLGLKDGGRVGYNLGGLTEQGQRLYDSMSSYGFNDMEIASALDEQQLYPESMTLGMKEEVVTPGKVKSIIPTSDGEGGGGITNITNSNPNFDYETAAYGLDNLTAAEKGLTEEEQKTIDFQKGKDGLMSFAKGLGYALNPLAFFAKKGYNLYKNKVRDSRYREEERLRMEEFQKQKAAALAFEEEKLANTAFQNAMANPTAFYASLNDGAGATSTAESRSTAGTDDTPGTPFANGGLATMFVRRR